MHTLHWWAVEAEDKEDAFNIVKGRLITDEGNNWVDWSDWHVVGGGRWNSVGNGYDDQSNMIVSYAEDPEKFKEILEDCKKGRVREMNDYMVKLNYDRLVSDIVDYISNNGVPDTEQRFDMNSYYFKKAGELLSANYTPDSYFYDYVEYTAHMGYIQERLDNPERPLIQFLVPIDFHF